MRTIDLEIPTDVLRASGATIPEEWADCASIDVELHYCPGLNFANDVPYFEGTVDGTWKDEWDANKLPLVWITKALREWENKYED